MKKCNCNRDINISSADIVLKPGGAEGVNVRKNDIQIVITREPDTPTIAELRRQIEELQALGLKLNDIDQRLADAISGLDLATKAYLAEVLESYSTKSELQALHDSLMQVIAQERDWANGRFVQKVYLTKQAYDALTEEQKNAYNGNVMYIITD